MIGETQALPLCTSWRCAAGLNRTDHQNSLAVASVALLEGVSTEVKRSEIRQQTGLFGR